MWLLNVTGQGGDTEGCQWVPQGHCWCLNLWGPGHSALELRTCWFTPSLMGGGNTAPALGTKFWGWWCVTTSVGCHVAQQTSLLCNEISPRRIPTLEASWCSWRFSESALLKQTSGLHLPISPPMTPCLRWGFRYKNPRGELSMALLYVKVLLML